MGKQEEMDLKVKSAIAELFGSEVMVVKYIAMAEVIDADGDRGVVPVLSEECELWDAIGLTEALGADLKNIYAFASVTEIE